VAHAVSASYLRSERMSPEGWALAVLLHALVAFFLWWMSQNRPPIIPTEDVVEVSFELPKAPEPPPPPPAPTAPPTPAPAPPPEGLRPPAEITSENPTQVRPTSQNPTDKNVPLSPPQSLERALPQAEPEPPPPTSQAFAQPPQPQPAPKPPQDSTEKAIEDAFAKARPPLPKPEPPKPEPPKVEPKPAPQPHAAIAVPPANPNPRPATPYQPRPAPPQIAPSPLSRIPQQQQATATARGAEAPQSSTFVNPADTYNKARAADNYLWEVVRRLQGYRYQANVQASQGVTVVSVTIARDGRLLNVAIARSSGYPQMDQGVMAGVRAGSPYSPLPDTIQGASATFNLPLISTRGP
jgi:TonB family protein